MHRLALLSGFAFALALAGCNCDFPVAVVPDTGAHPDSGPAHVPDGATQEQDGAVTASDAAVVDLDGSLPEIDGSVPEADGSVNPIPDGSVGPIPDGSVNPIPDGSVGPSPDGSVNPIADGGVNHAPVVSVPATYVVQQGASLTMTATASDPDGDLVSYSWQQTGGTPTVTLTGTATPSASFVAPTVAKDSQIIITVTACDPFLACSGASTVVTINMPPGLTANASPSPVNEGALATLTATAVDPGDTLTYQWTQTLGPAVSLSSTTQPVVTFTAPIVTADTHLGFDVQVCDSFAACSNATVALTVKDVNHPPVAVATVSPSPASVLQTVTLDASTSTDPDVGDVLTFLWTQTAGPTVTIANPTAAKTSFTAPVVQDDTILTFSVKVCDQLGQCDTATVSVTVLGVSTYVSEALGNDVPPGQGTKLHPWKSIPKAIATAVTYGFTTVYVDKGNYPANVTMVNGIAVQCGYDSTAAWARTGTTSTIVAGTPAVLFPAGANATLDGCTVNVTSASPTGDAVAINVQSASPQIINCIADGTVPATTMPPARTAALVLNGVGTATVTGGSYTGGNGTSTAEGIRVAGLALTIGPSSTTGVSVFGTTKAGTQSAWGIDVTSGSLSANQVTVSAGPAAALSVGIAAAGGNTSKIDVAGSTIKGGDVGGGPGTQPESDGVAVSGIAAVTIARCAISAGSGGFYSNGVRCTSTAMASITACSPVGPVNYGISGAGSTIESFGVRLETCPATLTGNTIHGGGSSPLVAGIDVENGIPNIQSNMLIQGGSGNNAVGVLVRGGNPNILSNTLIQGAAAVGLMPPLRAAGISAAGGAAGNMPSATIADNVLIEGGTSQSGSVGILLVRTTGVTVARNTTIRGGTCLAADWGLADGDPITSGSGNSINLLINRNLIVGTPLDPLTSPTVAIAGGLYLGVENGSVTNSRILGGLGTTAYGVRGSTSMGIWNNYISPVGVTASTSMTVAYGLYMQSNGAMGTFNNNIIDTGRAAMTRYGFYENAFFTPVGLHNNDFYPDAPLPPYTAHLYRTAAGGFLDTAATIDTAHPPASSNTLVANPLFVNEANWDFHLKALVSPCLDKGLAAGAPKDDMDGDQRPSSASDPGVEVGPDEVP